MNFLNLLKKYTNKNQSKINIIPINSITNVTKGKGANNGPKKIIDSSFELEYYDMDLEIEPYLKGIYTAKEKKYKLKKNQDFFEFSKTIQKDISKFVQSNKFNIFLGSDHSSTYPVFLEYQKKYKDLSVIVLDAHADLREPWGKDSWWHACVTRFISKHNKTCIFGLRSLDYYESIYIKQNKNINYINARDFINKDINKKIKKQLSKLSKNVIISIDVDVFDPSIISQTNTPEPGGLNYNQILDILEMIFKNKNVLSTDIVEFSPNSKKIDSESYTLSKLVYKIIAYKQFYNKL